MAQDSSVNLYHNFVDTPFDEAVFQSPPPIFRGAPFWAWNSRLDPAQLREQIHLFRKMGFGGVHLHARTGLKTEYLGPVFLDAVRSCLDAAETEDLLIWLYDEDRWPSGFGAGKVTADPAHRLKYLLFTPLAYNGTIRKTPNWSRALGAREENGELLARYAVRLNDAGELERYRRLAPGEVPIATETEWFAYLETSTGVPWFNHQCYVDTLSPGAIARFTEVSHDHYAAAFQEHFGSRIPAIFTDEPQHVRKECFQTPHDRADRCVPATSDFFTTFSQRFGSDLLETLPEIFWELPERRTSLTRYRYHDHVTERFSEAYAGTLSAWTRAHGLALTGHMMEEPTLESQTEATGEAMRSLFHFQLPGVDILCDDFEFTSVKQAQSIARQNGCAGVMSELYGVTGWDYRFADYKGQGDWQAALGVTVRVPHLSYLSMKGEAKRDFPASIHFQSPWWEEFKVVEDHFARINYVLSRGKPIVRVGMIHPIESYWLTFGPLSTTAEPRHRLDERFSEISRWLLQGLIDFDYLCESILPRQNAHSGPEGMLSVGEASYAVVLVPSLATIRKSTLEILEEFVDRGGQVVFLGENPRLVDAEPSDRTIRLADRATALPWSGEAVLEALQPWREIECLDDDGKRPETLLYQLRHDGNERHLFLCHRDREQDTGPLSLSFTGRWRAFTRDTSGGACEEMPVRWNEGKTFLSLTIPAHGHLLLTFRPAEGSEAPAPPFPERTTRELSPLIGPFSITLSESNVLLLDRAQWRWNEGDWNPPEELLRVGNRLRELCGLPPHEGHVAQPWIETSLAQKRGRVSLRFAFFSTIALEKIELALEEPEAWTILLDGREIASRPKGWWVDPSIQTVRFPSIARGKHTLVLTRDFTDRTSLEWCYLLGDFGVRLEEPNPVLDPLPQVLRLGDWTQQGLPFYGGNVTYDIPLLVACDRLRFRFQGSLIAVHVKGRERQLIPFAPFIHDFDKVLDVPSEAQVTVFGHRHNAFGPIHHADRNLRWKGPDAWRSTGAAWSEAHMLRAIGLESVVPGIKG